MPSPMQRLEKALQISLFRAHGGDPYRASQLDNALHMAYQGEYVYRAWQDARRLINQLEALEAAHGVRHVRIKYRLRDAYRTGEFYA